MQYYHRIGTLYCEAIQSYMQALESPPSQETDYERHVQQLHMIFHLAQVIYFPEDGSGMGVVGEELLHWLNAHDVAPTTEQGQAIAQTLPAHDHPDYWDYVFRCVLRGFYGTAATVLQSYVDSSVSPTLQNIAREIVHILKSLPRSTAYATEQSFFSAHRHWLTSVRVFLSGFQRLMDQVEGDLKGQVSSPNEERLELEAQFRCLLELLCGVKERVLEFSEDWKEALCTWGTLVHPAMRRDDLPEVLQTITDALPADGTLQHECILSALLRGDMVHCLKTCLSFDEWLAAHLGDYCDKAQLLDGAEPGTEEAQSLMEQILSTWANTLLKEERLWRMALSYLNVIQSPAARSQMRSILFDVPLLDIPTEPGTSEADAQLEKVEEVVSACIEYGMDDEVRLICRRLGHDLMERQKYGLAIAYSVRARDGRQVRVIADRMLHDYVKMGPDHFVASVNTVPRVLIDDAAALSVESPDEPMSTPFVSASSIFSQQTFAPLVFHFKYRDFHEAFRQPSTWREAAQILVELLTSDVTPESFLSVLLVDALPLLQSSTLYFTVSETYELLRITEKVASVAEINDTSEASDFYFYWLEQLLSHKQGKEGRSLPGQRRLAQERMLVVRLALSQYLSRILVENQIP